MAEWVGIVVTVLSAAVASLLAWIWQLWSSHTALKLHVAENYLHKDEHAKSEQAQDKRMARMERLSQRTYEIMLQVAAKLDIRVSAVQHLADEE